MSLVRFRPEAPFDYAHISGSHKVPNREPRCGCSSSGRAPPCQGGGSEFEPRHPLQFFFSVIGSKDPIATVRWTVARDGLTERNLDFCVAKMQTSEFTPSDSNLNDILLTQYDIRLSPHDILAFGKHDIISVPSYAKHISSTAGGYHTEGISPVPQGTDIIEKRQVSVETCRFSWRYRPDLNWGMRVLQTLALPLGHGTI